MSNKHEATYHGGKYTPSTDRVREEYRNGRQFGELYSKTDFRAEFDRWLATVKAEALTDLADQMHDRFTASWIRGKARELTHGPQKISGAFAVTENESEADCGDND